MFRGRDISIQGEGNDNFCAVINQLWGRLIFKYEKYCLMGQQPNLQLIDNCTSCTLPFPLHRDFPGSGPFINYKRKFHPNVTHFRHTKFTNLDYDFYQVVTQELESSLHSGIQTMANLGTDVMLFFKANF